MQTVHAGNHPVPFDLILHTKIGKIADFASQMVQSMAYTAS
jgi:hypothetical protein